LRAKQKQWIGEKSSAPSPPSEEVDPLQVAVRSHQNYTENIPMALLLAAIVELNGGNRRVLNGGLAALLLFRVLHVELGLRGEEANAKGRLIGHAGTAGFMGGMAAYAAYLVKGYWGY
jgi:uncharacterized membrane protein YecN with MAPEG domain